MSETKFDKDTLLDLVGQVHEKRREQASQTNIGTLSVLQHLTHARHMCYKRMFTFENCLRWQKATEVFDPRTCAESRLLFQACNAELLRKVRKDCPTQLDDLVKCLNKNHQDASKCAAQMLPFDRCTEDYMPGVPGTFF